MCPSTASFYELMYCRNTCGIEYLLGPTVTGSSGAIWCLRRRGSTTGPCWRISLWSPAAGRLSG